MNIKDCVRLRQRKQKTGNISLYLDIYRNGKRNYEYLKLYLIPETNREAKLRNKQTLQFAEAVRAKRAVEIINNEYQFRTKKCSISLSALISRYEQNHSKKDVFNALMRHIRIYDKRQDLLVEHIDESWVEGFINHLKHSHGVHNTSVGLKRNTQLIYLATLKTLLSFAVKQRYLISNPAANITIGSREETRREYLTVDEIKQLANEPCAYDVLKRAFLFACITGLRNCDVRRLTWGDVYEQGQFTRLIFRQQKTKRQEYLDISPEAAMLLGKRGEPSEKVFPNLIALNSANNIIKQWVLRAGIKKNITFHCSRHSFAIMMIESGSDIYTVSKLLGHRDIATTQIYAKILDKKKQEAIMNIPSIFGD